jgi:hypothetical protein
MISIPFNVQFNFVQTLLVDFLYIRTFLLLKTGLKPISIFFDSEKASDINILKHRQTISILNTASDEHRRNSFFFLII